MKVSKVIGLVITYSTGINMQPTLPLYYFPLGKKFIFKGEVYIRVALEIVNVPELQYQRFCLNIKTNKVVSFYYKEEVLEIQ